MIQTKPQQHSFDDALAALLAAAPAPKIAETVPLNAALNRVLATDIVSPIDVPPANNSQMDGYAVRSSDCTQAGAVLTVTQRIPAGKPSTSPLLAGQAARIFTGGFMPQGADAVVMQEACSVSADVVNTVTVNEAVAAQQWVRPQGSDVALGSTALLAGTRLNAAQLGLVASLGQPTVAVAPRLRVGLLCTGDELIEPGKPLPFGSIYNSNRPMLAALLQGLGCEVVDAGNVADTLPATQAALADLATRCDVIVSTGGVSVGEEDHVKPAVQALGELNLWSIAIKPGKPLAFGRVANTPFIGLPGNPVSGFVTFIMLVRPYLLRSMGVVDVTPPRIPVIAGFEWTKADKRREFLRVQLNAAGQAELFPNQNSGVLTSAAWAHGIVDVTAGSIVRVGDTVNFIPMAALL
jgi:molybdopterin molybdotransferase